MRYRAVSERLVSSLIRLNQLRSHHVDQVAHASASVLTGDGHDDRTRYDGRERLPGIPVGVEKSPTDEPDDADHADDQSDAKTVDRHCLPFVSERTARGLT